ncbi:aminopeptidase P family protein [Burkholderia sp. PU8-34]
MSTSDMSGQHSPRVIRQRVRVLRSAMKAHGLAAYIVPTGDPHLSEYPLLRWRAREWLSGFSGSAGTLVVTADSADLFTDGRYWEQAEAELDGTGIGVRRVHDARAQGALDLLGSVLEPGDRVGVDGRMISLREGHALCERLAAAKLALHSSGDVLATVWPDRPGEPTGAISLHPRPYAVRTVAQNLWELRVAMKRTGASWHLVSTLDDIAFLLNLRGNDIDYNPVFAAHLVVGMSSARLYVGTERISAELCDALAVERVLIEPYREAADLIAAIPSGDRVLVDPARTTFSIADAARAASVDFVAETNPSALSKSRKLPIERAHIHKAMRQDGAALCEFFSWLEAAIEAGEPVYEWEIHDRLVAFRAGRQGFVGASFETVAGFNANGALPHYSPSRQGSAQITGSGMLLVDSGGHYLGGTTDVTRVVPLGEPSRAQKRDYTLVLKALIALSTSHFPEGVHAPVLDAIARRPLWRRGVDYNHGTGHGVGYFLNVHEGLFAINYFRASDASMAIREGMITSIEPGIYRPGRWGIRLENLAATIGAQRTQFGAFLRFETLTLCPFDRRCIERSMLADSEVRWLNDYHARVRKELTDLVSGPAADWLIQHTEPVQ